MELETEEINSSEMESSNETHQETFGPGVRRGTKRQKYRKYRDEKKRVIEAGLKGEDWEAVAQANYVNLKTAYGWLRTYDEDAIATPKKRGGARNKKILQVHIDAMIEYVEEDPLISLQLIKSNILRDHQMNVSTTSIHKYLEGQFYSIKKVLPQPSAMNSAENKQKRSNYVSSVMASIGQGKHIVYIDETNCNLFLRRSFGRSKKGVRCTVNLPTSKGKNIHVIAGICQTGMNFT